MNRFDDDKIGTAFEYLDFLKEQGTIWSAELEKVERILDGEEWEKPITWDDVPVGHEFTIPFGIGTRLKINTEQYIQFSHYDETCIRSGRDVPTIQSHKRWPK